MLFKFCGIFSVIVQIGFDPAEYNTSEDDGAVNVMIRVIAGEVTTPLLLNIQPQNGTAIGIVWSTMNKRQCPTLYFVRIINS